MRRLRDRLFAGANSPGSVFWGLVAVGLIWAVWSAAVGNWRGVAEGVLGAAVIVGVISIASRSLGWRFWPW